MKNSPSVRNLEKKRAMSLFDDFFHTFYDDNYRDDSRMMALDIMELDNKYQIIADLPGVAKENVKVSTKDNQLLIEAEVKREDEDNSGTFHRRERFSGWYQRTINLSEFCDPENIKAKLENGVLTLDIPKIEPKPLKEIIIE